MQAQTGKQQQQRIVQKAEGKGQELTEEGLQGAVQVEIHEGRSLKQAIIKGRLLPECGLGTDFTSA